MLYLVQLLGKGAVYGSPTYALGLGINGDIGLVTAYGSLPGLGGVAGSGTAGGCLNGVLAYVDGYIGVTFQLGAASYGQQCGYGLGGCGTAAPSGGLFLLEQPAGSLYRLGLIAGGQQQTYYECLGLYGGVGAVVATCVVTPVSAHLIVVE